MDQQDQMQWWEDWQEIDAFWSKYIDTRPQPATDDEDFLLDVPF